MGRGAVAEERDFDRRLAAIARELVNEPDMQHTLQRIVELAAADQLEEQLSVELS